MRPIKAALCVLFGLWFASLNLTPIILTPEAPGVYSPLNVASAAGPATAGVNWEVRTTGSDLNGGGFDLGLSSTCTGGTDYSQSDTPHVTFNGTSITGTSAGAGSTITPSGYTVATTDKCNLLNVASGTNITAGIYLIISVNTGTNTWTLDHAITTGAGSALVGRMGGGLATIAVAIANWNPLDTVWIKTGTYTQTSSLSPVANSGTAVNMTYVQGYGTVHGDSGTATITSATNSVNLWNINAALTYVVFANLNMTHTAGTRGDGFRASHEADQISFINDTFDGCQVGINGDGTTGDMYGLLVARSTITNSVTNGIATRCGITALNNFFSSNTNAGIQDKGCTTGIKHMVLDNGFYGNQYGYNMTNASNQEIFQISGNGFASQTADNIRINTASPTSLVFYNNISYGATAYGADYAGTATLTPIINGPNAYGSNGTANFLHWTAGTGDVALSACNPFTSASTGNFSLSACGKTALAGLGYPGVSPLGTGYRDIGPLQLNGAATGNTSFVQ